MAVVPVENSTEAWSVRRWVLESALHIVGEVELPIVHHLLVGGDTTMEKITAVCGHEQALGQCREWLDANLPGVRGNVPVMARQRCGTGRTRYRSDCWRFGR